MLDSPFLVSIRYVYPFVYHLIVNIATHFCQVSHEFYKLVFVFYKLFNCRLLSLFSLHFRPHNVLLDHSIKVGFCSFDEVFDKV